MREITFVEAHSISGAAIELPLFEKIAVTAVMAVGIGVGMFHTNLGLSLGSGVAIASMIELAPIPYVVMRFSQIAQAEKNNSISN